MVAAISKGPPGMKCITTFLAVGCLVGGCATHEPPITAELAPGRLPPPDTRLEIEGLGPCTDSPDRSLRLDSSQPVHVLVHGCYGSSGQFRALAQVLAFHGQQAACFTYDDRARLDDSAAALRRALGQLVGQSGVPAIDVIGHSQGALIARKALAESADPISPGQHAELRLVTISGPFSGIDAARTCGRTWLYPLTLGLLPLGCYLATGPKWLDITYSSRFILEPGPLSEQVAGHLKIDTDERGSCRREDEQQRCIDSDDVFSLAEQRSPRPDTDPRVTHVQVQAGHVEIVGDKRVAPAKLIAILQDQGVLRPTPPARASAFEALLSKIYLKPGDRLR